MINSFSYFFLLHVGLVQQFFFCRASFMNIKQGGGGKGEICQRVFVH